jgi:hypothetical protein
LFFRVWQYTQSTRPDVKPLSANGKKSSAGADLGAQQEVSGRVLFERNAELLAS